MWSSGIFKLCVWNVKRREVRIGGRNSLEHSSGTSKSIPNNFVQLFLHVVVANYEPIRKKIYLWSTGISLFVSDDVGRDGEGAGGCNRPRSRFLWVRSPESRSRRDRPSREPTRLTIPSISSFARLTGHRSNRVFHS